MALSRTAAVPVIYAIISKGTFMYSLRLRRRARILLSPLIFGAGIWSTRHSSSIPEFLGLPVFWNLFLLVWMHHAFNVLYLESLELPPGTSTQLWHYAYRNYHNPRWAISCSSKYQTPVESSGAPNKNLKFALRRFAKLAFCWLIQVYVVGPTMTEYFQLTAADFSPARQTYFRRVLFSPKSDISAKETQLRAFMSLYWVWYAYIMLDGAHIIFSIIFASILGLDPVDDWPPLFGNLLEAYSLRRFWGRFWHSLASPACIASGHVITRKLTPWTPDSRNEKTFIAFWTFFVSGVLHAVAEWQAGAPVMPVEEMMFWVANFAAVAVEMITIGQVKHALKKGGYKNILSFFQSRFMSRVVGYTWVTLFFFWIAPKWQYPKVRVGYNSLQSAEYPHELTLEDWLVLAAGKQFGDDMGGNATTAGFDIFTGLGKAENGFGR